MIVSLGQITSNPIIFDFLIELRETEAWRNEVTPGPMVDRRAVLRPEVRSFVSWFHDFFHYMAVFESLNRGIDKCLEYLYTSNFIFGIQ